MKSRKRLGAAMLSVLCLSMCLCTTAFADTDGTEPKITQQPDQLVLQLGTRWAGVEFELRTDAGLFPVPIVVDDTGVLTMDLGGSKTYTLSCISSSVPIPDPVSEQQGGQAPSDTQQPPSDAVPPAANSQQEQPPQAHNGGIPTGPLVIFLVGLACGVGGLVALYLSKRHRQDVYDDWDDEDEYEE